MCIGSYRPVRLRGLPANFCKCPGQTGVPTATTAKSPLIAPVAGNERPAAAPELAASSCRGTCIEHTTHDPSTASMDPQSDPNTPAQPPLPGPQRSTERATAKVPHSRLGHPWPTEVLTLAGPYRDVADRPHGEQRIDAPNDSPSRTSASQTPCPSDSRIPMAPPKTTPADSGPAAAHSTRSNSTQANRFRWGSGGQNTNGTARHQHNSPGWHHNPKPATPSSPTARAVPDPPADHSRHTTAQRRGHRSPRCRAHSTRTCFTKPTHGTRRSHLFGNQLDV